MEIMISVGWPADYALETLRLSAHDCMHDNAAAPMRWFREGSYVPPVMEAAPCLLLGDHVLAR
jgi:hypothetical protein